MPVDLGQVALAEHQEMSARLGFLVCQRQPELFDEVPAVAQAGDGVPVDFALQRFNAGVLFLHRGGNHALRVDQRLIHAGQRASAAQGRIVARRQRTHAFADIARSLRFHPPDQVQGKQ
ncbi:hypothetical protein D9M68_565730 [compost metagenome]